MSDHEIPPTPDEALVLHLEAVKSLTHNNDHIGACKRLAVAVSHERAVKMFAACETIRDLEMECHDDLRKIVDRWRRNLLRFIEVRYSSRTYAKVKQSV